MTDRDELAEFLGLVAFGMSDRKTQDKLYEAASALSAEPETVNGLEIFSGEYVRLSDYRLLEEANKRLLDPEVTQLSAQQVPPRIATEAIELAKLMLLPRYTDQDGKKVAAALLRVAGI